jgi:hypothetical protein
MAKIILAILAAAPFAAASYADTLLLDGIDVAKQTADLRPKSGMSMTAVESAFGSPSQRRAAVGEPPITRWDYPAFSVYFEHDRVIHAVARRE